MSHPLRFPGTKKLDASFPSVLRDSETWNEAREELTRAMILSKDEEEDHAPFYPQVQTADTTACLAWGDRTKVLKDQLSNEVAGLRRHVHQQEMHLLRQRALLVSILKVAQSNPLMAGDLLREGGKGLRKGSTRWLRRAQGRCVAKADSQQRCSHAAIPYSKYCIEHITADKRQVLYRSCTATDQDVPGRCNKVVTDILSEKGLCSLHLAAGIEVKKSTTKLAGSRTKSTPIKLKVSRKPLTVPVTSTPLPRSPRTAPGPPPLVPASDATADRKSPKPALASSLWIPAESKMERRRETPSPPPLTTLPQDPLLAFTSEAPSTMPAVDLLPLDPTLHGSIMDDSSSSSC